MRVIGSYTQPKLSFLPTAQALREAAAHQTASQALQALPSTGHVRGIYRFKSHEEMNRHDDEALLRAMSENNRHQKCN